MKNNKGITLISLIASIILITILSSITIVTSINAYNQMKFEGAKVELEELQKLVDEIASDYQTYLKENDVSKTYTEYFYDRYGADDFADKLLSVNRDKVSVLVVKFRGEIENAFNSSSAFYFSSDDLSNYFGLKGIDDVVVEFSTRTIYSVNGIKDPKNSDQIYYTPSEWGVTVIRKNSNIEEEDYDITVTEKYHYGDNYDLEIKIFPKLNNKVNEVFLYQNGKYIKIDNFRCVLDDIDEDKTIIRVTVNGSGEYKIRIVDELKNYYETDIGTLI